MNNNYSFVEGFSKIRKNTNRKGDSIDTSQHTLKMLNTQLRMKSLDNTKRNNERLIISNEIKEQMKRLIS